MAFLLSDSLMCVDLLRIGEQVQILEKYMNWHHADIMDGHYCPNITLSPDIVRAVCGTARLPVEVHLMVERPAEWIDRFAGAGAAMIALHAETINSAAFRLIRKVRSVGCKVGIALNPATPLSCIQHYLDEIDRLTLMTVDVGYAGQPMVPQVVDKIREAARLKAELGLKYEIQIDGCCNKTTYGAYARAGAEMLVMGSGLFGLDQDLDSAAAKMRLEQENACSANEQRR